MSLLLPKTRAGTVHSTTPVSIHGDRYVDLVSVRFTIGVMVRVAWEVG